MKDFFHAIEDLFVNVLFLPLDALRELQKSSWFLANTISWILILIGMAAFIYWMMKLKDYNEDTEYHHEYDHHINSHTTHHTVEH